ncbi:MAG: membrane protein insertion efficiency factor YidD [Betaproteobacteria bacterium]
MNSVLIWLTRQYQRFVSPLFGIGASCRFYPTCSEYMVQSLRARGSVRGLAFGLWRLMRCHPFCEGGHDPVTIKTKNLHGQ